MNKKQRGKKAVGNIFRFVVLPIITTLISNWKYGLGVLALFILIKIIKVKRKGYLLKDVKGEEVKTREFFKRWKAGIEGITPLQQAKTNLMGNWITLSGVLAGIVVNAVVRMENQWLWIETILFGSLILIVIQMIGGLQKYWRFKVIDKAQKKLEEEMNKIEIQEDTQRQDQTKTELGSNDLNNNTHIVGDLSYLMPKQ